MQISASSFRLTPAIRTHVEDRLSNALSKTGISPEMASVHLLDINGGRGGIDKQCRVKLPLKAGGTLLAVMTSNDLYAAVDGAAMRVRDLLRRHRARRRHARIARRGSLRLTPVT
jgi:ribosome-associated translation inhibitor RaiA